MNVKTLYVNAKAKKNEFREKVLFPLGKGLKTGFETGSFTEGISTYKSCKKQVATVYENRANMGKDIRKILGVKEISINGKLVPAYGFHAEKIEEITDKKTAACALLNGHHYGVEVKFTHQVEKLLSVIGNKNLEFNSGMLRIMNSADPVTTDEFGRDGWTIVKRYPGIGNQLVAMKNVLGKKERNDVRFTGDYVPGESAFDTTIKKFTIARDVLTEIAETGSAALWPKDREIPVEEANKLANLYVVH